MLPLSGVTAALLTPRIDEGELDIDGVTAQIEFISTHCEAISVLGAGVSEYQLLSAPERGTFLSEVVREVKSSHPGLTVVAGVSSPLDADVLRLADRAADAGADFLQLLIPSRPWGGELRSGEAIEYFAHIVPRLPLPVVAYHHPGLGSDPTLTTIEEICRVDGVVAIKDSSRNASRNLLAVRRLQDALGVSYLATIQPATLAVLAGAAGVMTPPPFTLLARAIVDACGASAAASLRELARVAAVVPTELCEQDGLLPGALEALRGLGVVTNGHSSPYDKADGAFRQLDALGGQWYRDRLRDLGQ
jgi:4-hydroxy-tetrahydrodipicolinate synthase